MTAEVYKVYFDGSKRNDKITTGFIVCTDIEDEATYIYCGHSEFFSSKYTSSYAEYTALLNALIFCVYNQLETVEIFGDAKEVIRQVQEPGIKNAALKGVHAHIRELLRYLPSVRLTWIPREQNVAAHRKAT